MSGPSEVSSPKYSAASLEENVVELVRLAHLALAEALDSLDLPARAVLRDALDLPDATVLRAAASRDHLARQVGLACAGLVDPSVLHKTVSRSLPSTSGASTAARRE